MSRDLLQVVDTPLDGVRLVEPHVFSDDRGYLYELWNSARWARSGLPLEFVQDNVAVSSRGVVRGLHFQYPNPQGKLVSVLHGEIFDVAVDIREGSPTFGRWTGAALSEQNHRSMFLPPGFAHGFAVLSERAMVLYKFTTLYAPEAQRGIAWDDPEIGIAWPAGIHPILSEKDQRFPRLRELSPDSLPGTNR